MLRHRGGVERRALLRHRGGVTVGRLRQTAANTWRRTRRPARLTVGRLGQTAAGRQGGGVCDLNGRSERTGAAPRGGRVGGAAAGRGRGRRRSGRRRCAAGAPEQQVLGDAVQRLQGRGQRRRPPEGHGVPYVYGYSAPPGSAIVAEQGSDSVTFVRRSEFRSHAFDRLRARDHDLSQTHVEGPSLWRTFHHSLCLGIKDSSRAASGSWGKGKAGSRE